MSLLSMKLCYELWLIPISRDWTASALQVKAHGTLLDLSYRGGGRGQKTRSVPISSSDSRQIT